MEQNNFKNSVMLEQLETAYEHLGIADDFLFGKVMQDKSLCVSLLELLTGNAIGDVENIIVQKPVKVTYDSKGVRYDVYVEDDQNRLYDAEMQNRSYASGELPKRSRFYQEMIDLNELEKGDSYTDLKDSYVIFICTFDPFDKNLCYYSFANFCKENFDLPLADGRNILFFNTKGCRDNVSAEIAEFLDYIETGISNGEFTGRLDTAVKKARMNREWKVEYMKERVLFMDARRDGYMEGKREGLADGRAEGRAEGKISTLNALVADGIISIDAAALRAGISVEEFLNKVKEIAE